MDTMPSNTAWSKSHGGEKKKKDQPVELADIHAACIYWLQAWDNRENNMHDLNTSWYPLWAPCLVREKKKKREGKREKNDL